MTLAESRSFSTPLVASVLRRSPLAAIAVALALGPLACGAPLFFPTPNGPGMKSALYVGFPEGGLAQLYAAPFGPAMPSEWSADVPARIVAALYEASLEELQLGPGVVALVSTDHLSISRPVPPPDLMLGISADTSAWSAATFAELATIRLEPFDYVSCVNAGGCAPADGAPDFCEIPCPEPEEPNDAHVPDLDCPAGWIDLPPGPSGTRRCEPPVPPKLDCPDAEYQLAFSDRCEIVGDPCPATLFPDTSGELRPIVYVDPAAPAGGDGSLGAPHRDLVTAAAGAPPGCIFALAKGDHALTTSLQLSNHEIRGACAEQTRILGSPGGASLYASGTGLVRLANITITGGNEALIAAGPNVRTELEGVAILGGASFGLLAFEPAASIALKRVLIRGASQRGFILDGLEGSLEDVVIERTFDAGLQCASSTITLDRVTVRGNRVDIAGRSRGMDVGFDCHVSGQDVLVEDHDHRGISVVERAELELDDFVVRDTRRGGPESGAGIWVDTDARAELWRGLVADNIGAGIHTSVRSELFAIDVVVRDSSDDRGPGTGILLAVESTSHLNRLRLENNGERELDLDSGPGHTVLDVAVRPGANAGGPDTISSVFLKGRNIEVDGLLIEDSPVQGLEARADEGMDLTDVIVRRCLGGGMYVSELGLARMTRVLIEDNGDRGVVFERLLCDEGPCGPIDLADVIVRGTRRDRLDAIGIELQEGSQVNIIGLSVLDTDGVGISAHTDRLSIQEGTVRGNRIGFRAPLGATFLPKALAGVKIDSNELDLLLDGPQ